MYPHTWTQALYYGSDRAGRRRVLTKPHVTPHNGIQLQSEDIVIASKTTDPAQAPDQVEHKSPRFFRWWRRKPKQAEPIPDLPPVASVAVADPLVHDTPVDPSRNETKPKRRRRRKAARPAEAVEIAPPDVPASFGPVSVSREVAQALHVIGYQDPTPVQEQCIPLMNANQDVVAQARTGTGKTAAFGIPLVEKVDIRSRATQAIVLAPTRELAVQVGDELHRLGQFKGVSVVACYGGQPIGPQIAALNAGAHIVVGTPGRVLDHLHRRTLSLENVRAAVLDEADEMLDIGFLPDIERILRQTPRERQTALFSATMHAAVRGIVHRHLRSPSWVRIDEELQTAPKVQQVYYEVWERDKVSGLAGLLHQNINGGKALLFLRTQAGVDHLVRSLQRHNVKVAGIHGGMTQPQRNSVMRSFKEGNLKVLAATNVAARGLDIPEVSHVVNYDMPQNMEEYVHRIGRTARMWADGTAITFVTEWDIDMLDTLIDSVGDDLERGTLPMYV